MPKYLWQVTYSSEGAAGLIAEGGTTRCNAIRAMVERVGGHVDVCYFSFGGHDLYVIGEVPDEMAAASLHLHTTASGAARTQGIPLLTPEQMDLATRSVKAPVSAA